MGKGTPAMGRRNTRGSHIICRRCGKHAFHAQHKVCASCGFGESSKMRSYSWQKK